MMLIDGWMPVFGASARHEIAVRAAADRTFAAIREADLASALTVRVLLALRGVPAALSQGRQGVRRLRSDASARLPLGALEQHGFRFLEEAAPSELVIGLEGRFWTPRGGITTASREHFRTPIPAGLARVVWNFAVAPSGNERSRLSTETRVAWSDPAAGRSFTRYWAVIRPWSGLTRRYMLRAIRAEAESA